jgi:hypothetical protein
MNKNLFNFAINDIKKSKRLNLNNDISNIKTLGKEFMDEIDFEKESLNLGNDLEIPEETNQKFKMNKIRNSLNELSREPYSNSKNGNIRYYRKLKINKNDVFFNHIKIEKPLKNILITKYNKKSDDKHSSKKEIISVKSSNSDNSFGFCCVKKFDNYVKPQNISLNYSVFIRNLPATINEFFVRELFNNCGKIISFHVIIY